ncbi:unnamed protein product [Cuscuta campestris]|uniref:DUF6598 domain-containing protein n=1 Tax=Cuscuta campestris TaxID=132261 RepID=A0A484MVM0_9ASTE|nr:unnamed protein product [Cuscuta campestris]
MEVFSVLIWSSIKNNGKAFENVHGIIKLVKCPCPDEFLFKKGLGNGIRVHPNEHLDIKAPELNIVGIDLNLEVDLKDGDGRAISYGEVCWDERSVDSPIVWYGKPLCSVIRGDIGYAALHYMLIPDGVYATVTVSIKRGGRNNNNNAHGSIFAEYSEYRYATWDRPIFNIDMGRVREQSIKGSCGNAVAVVNVLWSEVDPPFRLRENGGSSEVEEEYFCRDSDFGFCLDDDEDDCGDVSDLGSGQYLASQPTIQV